MTADHADTEILMTRSTFARRSATLASAAFALSLAVSACASSSESEALAGCEETYTMGFSHPVGEAQFVKALKGWLEENSPERCTEVLFDSTTANDLQTQRSTVESWVTQGVDAIVIWPVDTSAYENIMGRAQEQGTKWLTYASGMEGEDGSVGFDSEQSGRMIADHMGEWLDEHYPDGDISAAGSTQKSLPSLEGRWAHPKSELESRGIAIVSEQDCADQTCGLQIAENVLREAPDTRVFIGLNDDVALGMQKAVQNAGIPADEVYISGADGSAEALENLLAGDDGFKVTTALPVVDLGSDILDNVIAAITGEGDSATLTPSELVTPEDTDKINKLLEGYQ